MMSGPVSSFRLWLRVERRAEVITTSATADDCQLWHLGGQRKVALLLEKFYKFDGLARGVFGEQHEFYLILTTTAC
jgi:hypothetical protein